MRFAYVTPLLVVFIGTYGLDVDTFEDNIADLFDHLEVMMDWEAFMEVYKRNYKDEEERSRRFRIFLNNFLMVTKHNMEYKEGKHTYTMKINSFSDRTFEEILDSMTGAIIDEESQDDQYTEEVQSDVEYSSDLPDTVDWREQGAVTEVKNQGSCGSCWAFSSTGTLEGQYFLNTGNLTSLSEQELIDCAKSGGCKGGTPKEAFEFIKHDGGIYTEREYPYKAKNEECKTISGEKVAAIKGYKKLPAKNETRLQEAVANVGPISVCITVVSSFGHYHKGVYTDEACNHKSCNHAVLVVGYGVDEESGLEYWLVKNSWGHRWGDHGYIKIQRNNNNMCHISSACFHPIL